MKIKMIDLFKLMLERKAPKKIRVLGIDMTFIESEEWGDYKDDNGYRLSAFSLINCLNEDVEIIEEPKKIEKINTQYFDDERYIPEERLNICMNYIDKLIDEINNLNEKK